MTEPFDDGARPSFVRARLVPNTLVFSSSCCIMVIEIVAGRFIARYLGASIYTWTSVIAVVLAGIALGNWVGGKLADAFRPQRVLGILFALSSVLCLSILLLNEIAQVHGKEWVQAALSFMNKKVGGGRWPELEASLWPFRVFFSVAFVFFPPSCALGTISPVVAKMAIERSRKTGNAVGNVYAWGAIGSIVGTLLTGFVLIAWMGSRAIVLLVASVLAVLALACLRKSYAGTRRAAATLMSVASILGVGLALALAAAGWIGATSESSRAAKLGLREKQLEEGEYFRESQYYTIRVTEDEEDEVPVRVLMLDYLIHSYVDPTDPAHLVYDYEQVYAAVTRRFARGRSRLRAFFLGGGGYTFPRYIQAAYPGSQIDVAEIDPDVTRAALFAQGLDPRAPEPAIPGVREIFHMDGRLCVEEHLVGRRRYDFVYGDAFNDLSIPWHLTTREFCASIRSILAPDGAYLANVIDIWREARFLGAYVETLRQVFGPRNVAVLATEPVSDERGRDTFVVVASRRPLAGLLDGLGALIEDETAEPYLLTPADTVRLFGRSGGLILTDDFAPVDNLMIPVVRLRSD